MKRIYFFVLFFISAFTFGQKTVNNYKYVIVPKKFEFSKEDNQYQINALTKFLLEKYGFETYMKMDQKPEDLRQNPCLALTADLENNSGLFVTKMVFKLEDCYGNVVFESKEGRSREKDYKAAYHEAIRDAFTSVEELNYDYEQDPQLASAPAKQPQQEREVTSVEETKTTVSSNTEVNQNQPKLSKTVNTSGKTFIKGGIQYSLQETNNGFAIYQANAAEPFAMLIQSKGSGNYIYNSLTKQGIAYFDEKGNLTVEIFNPQTGETVKNEYRVKP